MTGFFGNLIGQGLGYLGSKLMPIPGIDGRKLGGAIGGLAPFMKGGRVLLKSNKSVGLKKGGKAVLKKAKAKGKAKGKK